jgi:hypothetical protein
MHKRTNRSIQRQTNSIAGKTRATLTFMRLSSTKKTSLSAVVAFLLILNIGIVAPINQAFAQFAVTAPAVETFTALGAKAGGTSAMNSVWQKAIKPTLDGIAVAAAQRVIVKLSNKAINSITGGGSGDQDTDIIQDFNQYFDNLKNEQISIYAKAYSQSDNPYAQQFAQGLIGSLSSPGGLRAPASTDFTLGQIVEPAVFAQDFNSGGYDAWTAMFIDPRNRPTGFFLDASSKLANSIQRERDNRAIQLTSDGIEPKQVCGVPLEFPDTETSSNETGNALNGGSDVVFDPSNLGEVGNQQGTVQDPDGPTWDPGQVALDSLNELCDTQITKVPAAFAVAYGSKALTAAFDNLANVDSMERMIGNALVDLAAYGIQEIRGHNNFVASIPTVSGANRPAGQSGLNVVDFTSGLEQQLEKTSTELEIMQKATIEYGKYPGQFAAMDRCLPGPDKGFESRLNDFVINKGLGRVDIIATRDSDRGERAAYAKEDLEISMKLAIQQTTSDIRNTKMNLPGAGAMLLERDAFDNVSTDYQEVQQRIKDKSAAIIGIRNAINKARSVGAPAFSDIANPIYTYADWDILSQGQKDAIYTIANEANGGTLENLTQSPNNLFQLGTTGSDVTLPGDLQPVTTVAQYQALSPNARRAVFLTANNISPTEAQLAAQDPNNPELSSQVTALLAQQQADPTGAAQIVTQYSQDYKRFIVALRFTWNRWEAYGTTVDENGQTVVTSDEVEDQKNSVRLAFLQFRNNLSSDESIADTETLLTRIQDKLKRVTDLTHDCRLLKYEIMTQYWDAWNNTGSFLRGKLVTRIQNGTIDFRTEDFKQDIVSGQSNILSYDCPTDGYFGWMQPPSGYTPNSNCQHSDANNDFYNIAVGRAEGSYQLRPTRMVQEVIVRDYFKGLYCRFDQRMMTWNTNVNQNNSGNLQPGYRFVCPGLGSSWRGQLFPGGADLPQSSPQSDMMRQNGPLSIMSNTGQTFLSFFGPVDPSGTNDYRATGYDYLNTGAAGLNVGQGGLLRDQFGDSIEPHLNWYVLSNAEASTEFFQAY